MSKQQVRDLKGSQGKSQEEEQATEMIEVENLDKLISVESENNTVVGRGEGYRTATGFDH